MKKGNMQLKQYAPIIVVLLGVVLVILSYLYGFKAYEEKTTIVNDQKAELEKQYSHLKKMYDEKEKYVKDTEEFEENYKNLIAKYDAAVLTEGIVMDAVNLSKDTEADVSSIALSEPEQVYTFGAATSKNPDNPQPSGINADYAGIKRVYSITSVGSYEETKDFIKNVLGHERRKVPTSASFTFDSSSGDITLVMNIAEYAITGNDREAKKITIPAMDHSVDNIFYDGILVTGGEEK